MLYPVIKKLNQTAYNGDGQNNNVGKLFYFIQICQGKSLLFILLSSSPSLPSPQGYGNGEIFQLFVRVCINPLKGVRLLMLILKIEMHSTIFCGTLIFYGI